MEDLASRIVKKALALGCQDAVADVVTNRSYQIRFARNEPVISNRWRETTASAFLVHSRRVLASDIKDLTRTDEAVERLVKIAKASQENPEYAGIARGPFSYARMAPDKKVLALEDGSDHVDAAIHGALASPEASGHGIAAGTRLSQFDPARAGRKAGRVASLAKSPKLGTPGKYAVVLDPLIFGALTDQVANGLGAWTVQAGLSPFGKKIGKRVASAAVTIVDDGSSDSIARKRFDAEGVPTRRNVLIQKGVLRTYLHNTTTAKRFKARTTGNAGLVSPQPHAVFLKPGDWSKDEIFEEVTDGLWLTNTWYTRYQAYVTGDLSTIPRDGIFRIRKGEVVESWKGIRVTDNLIRLMKNVVALSDAPEQMMWWGEVSVPNFVPYALVKDVNITTSAE